MAGVSCEIPLWWMSPNLTDDKLTLFRVMAWCHQATSHYLSQCWSSSMLPYNVPDAINSVWCCNNIWHQTIVWTNAELTIKPSQEFVATHKTFFQGNVYKNSVCKIFTSLPRPQCVNISEFFESVLCDTIMSTLKIFFSSNRAFHALLEWSSIKRLMAYLYYTEPGEIQFRPWFEVGWMLFIIGTSWQI